MLPLASKLSARTLTTTLLKQLDKLQVRPSLPCASPTDIRKLCLTIIPLFRPQCVRLPCPLIAAGAAITGRRRAFHSRQYYSAPGKHCTEPRPQRVQASAAQCICARIARRIPAIPRCGTASTCSHGSVPSPQAVAARVVPAVSPLMLDPQADVRKAAIQVRSGRSFFTCTVFGTNTR